TDEAVVLFVELLLDGELLLPGALQRPRHQPVLRLDRVILPSGPLRVVRGPLTTLLPEPIKCLALVLQPRGCLQGQFQRSRLEGQQHLLGDELIEAGAGHVLAEWAAVVAPRPRARS